MGTILCMCAVLYGIIRVCSHNCVQQAHGRMPPILPMGRHGANKLPAVAERARKRGEEISVGGAQAWSVSTYLLNAALLEEYSPAEREEQIKKLRQEVQVK